MPNPNVTRNELLHKRMLSDLPRRTHRTVGVDPDEIERLASEEGVFVADAETGIVVGQVTGDRLQVHYAFENLEAMRLQFKDAFEAVETEAMAVPGVTGVELQYGDMANRAVVEVILENCMFRRAEDWLVMGRKLPIEPPDEEPPATLADGARHRSVAEAETEALAAIDAAAYGDASVTAGALKALAGRGYELGAIESGGTLAGYVAFRVHGARGVVRRLAVAPSFQRRRYGSALLERAADRLIRLGARRLELTIVPNPTTIGFSRANALSQLSAGLTYRKKIGEKPEPTGLIIRGYGWSDMRRRR